MSLNKTELINEVAEKADMTKVDAEKAVKATMDAITEELASGGNVTLIGFGTFSVYERSARTGKNPRTGESLKIPAKKVPKFKAGKALSEAVDKPKKKSKKKKKK
jgi:DNA-binding protein HU-beta